MLVIVIVTLCFFAPIFAFVRISSDLKIIALLKITKHFDDVAYRKRLKLVGIVQAPLMISFAFCFFAMFKQQPDTTLHTLTGLITLVTFIALGFIGTVYQILTIKDLEKGE